MTSQLVSLRNQRLKLRPRKAEFRRYAIDWKPCDWCHKWEEDTWRFVLKGEVEYLCSECFGMAHSILGTSMV